MITSNSKITAVINPIYSKADHSTIDAIITFDSGEIYPYTAASYDNIAYGIQLWADLNAGKYGAIAAYIAPNLSPIS